LRATTSKTPPSESPAALAVSISCTIAAAAASSSARTGEASISSGVTSRQGVSSTARPIRTTRLCSATPNSARKVRATVPSATRIAVSRALARSSTSRMSVRSYLIPPMRSACPGRGMKTARAAGASSSGSSIRMISAQRA